MVIVAFFHSYVDVKSKPMKNKLFNITIKFSAYSLKLLMLQDSALKIIDNDLRLDKKMQEMKEHLDTLIRKNDAPAIENGNNQEQAAFSWDDL